MSVIYDIDFKKIVRWWTPLPLRKVFWLRLLGVLVYPIVELYQLFLLYRTAVLYDLMITPQVCYMESLLNERYDFTLRRIYIDDAVERPPLYLYADAESQPIDLYRDSEALPVDLYTDGEGSDYADDFIIWVPSALVFDPIEMRSLVMLKRLPGMKFKIQTF